MLAYVIQWLLMSRWAALFTPLRQLVLCRFSLRSCVGWNGQSSKGNSIISRTWKYFGIFNGYSHVFPHHLGSYQPLALANPWCAARWSRQESNSRSQPSKRFVGEAAFVTAIDHEPWSHWNMRWSAFFNWPLTTWIFINILVTSCGFHDMKCPRQWTSGKLITGAEDRYRPHWGEDDNWHRRRYGLLRFVCNVHPLEAERHAGWSPEHMVEMKTVWFV